MKIQWNEPLGLPECPYIRRWVIDFGPFAIRLHKWLGSDDDRHLHDHPWWFWTIVLTGSYVDESEKNGLPYFDILQAGSMRFRPANHKHTVRLYTGEGVKPTWTFLITGRPIRRWGFWVNGKLIKRDKYFVTHGHHPCDVGGEPVRMKPHGERV